MDRNAAPAVHAVERPLGRGRTRAEYRWLAAGVGVTDVLSLLLAFGAAYVLRFGFADAAFDIVAVTLVAIPLWLAVFAAFRLYAFARLSPTEEVRRLVWAVTVGITGIVT